MGVKVSLVCTGRVRTPYGEKVQKQRVSFAGADPLSLKAEDVARGIVGLVRWPRRQLILPWWMRPLAVINSLFPALVDLTTGLWVGRLRREELAG